jgi:hypothetical protein
MKKLKRAIAAITLVFTLMFSAGSIVRVKAQGTSESKSGGPSSSSGTMTEAEWAYFLWLLFMWLCCGGL